MTYRIVKISWTDASSIDDWKLAKDLPDEAFPCMSVGFLVKQNKQYYYLSNTHTREDSEGEQLVTGIIMIPKKWVLKYEILEDNS